MVVSTAGGNYDTTLSAFSGTRGSLAPIGCDDDSGGGTQSRLSVEVTAGVRYHFKVAALSTPSSTSLILRATTPTAPANDDFADAAPISALPHVSDVDISAATVEPDEPTSRCARPDRSIWSALTVPGTTSVTVSELSNSANLAVYAGNAAGGLDEVRCAAYSSDGLTFRATAGTTYHVRVGTSDDSVNFLRVRVAVAGPIRLTSASTRSNRAWSARSSSTTSPPCPARTGRRPPGTGTWATALCRRCPSPGRDCSPGSTQPSACPSAWGSGSWSRAENG